MTTNNFSSFKTKKPKPEATKSFAPPIDSDGASVVIDSPNVQGGVNASGYFGTYLDIEGQSRTENELIKRYREIATYPEVDMAIEDIVNEAISDLEDERLVTLDLSDVKISDGLKNKIHKEFDEVTKLLDFEKSGHNTFKRWYIDGRIYFHKVIDEKNPAKGIKELRYLDPRKMKKIVAVVKDMSKQGAEVYTKTDEFFMYTNTNAQRGNGYQFQGVTAARGTKIPLDEIAYVTSGEIDYDQNLIMSYLHKAIKIVNQVRMMEDALVIYRMSRAPERRIFYVDTGNMPKPQAEAHIKNLMTTYRNKTVFDSATGQIKDDRKFAAMIEDFWIPRQGGSNATEIDTLAGGENLDQIADLLYFQKNLYKALNVPVSRLSTDTNTVAFGRQSEVNRDELKFSKFVSRLRRKFSELFSDILKTQLILKNIFTEQDWDAISDKITYTFSQDSYYAEAKEVEILRNRIELLQELQPYVGIFFDKEYVYKKVLRMTDEEIVEREQGIQNDAANGFFGISPEITKQEMMGEMLAQQMLGGGEQQQGSPPTSAAKPNTPQPMPDAPMVQNQPD